MSQIPAGSLVCRIVKESLGHIRTCQNLVTVRYQIDPYLQATHPICSLRPKLTKVEKNAQELVYERKIAPEIFTCNPIHNALVIAGTMVF